MHAGLAYGREPSLGLLGWLIALVIALCAIPLAVANARLLPAVRHVCNLHYLVLTPCLLYGWTLRFPEVIVNAPGGALVEALRGGMAGGAAGAVACLATSAAPHHRQWNVAACSAMAGLALAAPGVWTPLVLLPAVLVGLGLTRPVQTLAPAAPLSNGTLATFGFLSLLGVSVLALASLAQMLGVLLLPAIRDLSDSSAPAAVATPHVIWFVAEAFRLAAAVFGACLVGALAVPLMRRQPRGAQFPVATIAAAIGFLIGIETLAPALDVTSGWMMFLWAAESMILGVVALVAYWFGVRRLRNLAEPAPVGA